MLPTEYFLYLSAFLFCIGLAIVLTKKHVIANLMGLELMLNAGNLNLVAFNRNYPDSLDGQVFSLFVMVVAAAEVAVALAIIIQAYKHYNTANLEEIEELKG